MSGKKSLKVGLKVTYYNSENALLRWFYTMKMYVFWLGFASVLPAILFICFFIWYNIDKANVKFVWHSKCIHMFIDYLFHRMPIFLHKLQ